MGRFWHILKANKSSEYPRNWCFVDTETTEEKPDKLTKFLSLKLGAAIYEREARAGHPAKQSELVFLKPGQFWQWFFGSIETEHTAVLMGYNVGFDFRVLDGFRELSKRGLLLVKLYTGQSVFIADYRGNGYKVLILDACNYFDGKLETWGTMLGLPKLSVNFNRVSTAKLTEYCRRDVEILRKLWHTWREFCESNDLGHFSVTRSAQALAAFTHRFMTVKVFIHADKEATELERQAYYGGRVECFHIGTLPRGRYFKLDVNSMYPSVMREASLPCRFVKVYSGFTPYDLREYARGNCCVAEVRLTTDEPAYPVKQGNTLLFPVGTFSTVLCGAELELALRRGHVDLVGRVSAYRSAILFREYVDTLYRIRKGYDKQGNKIMSAMVKKVLNSLYGKFGQRGAAWTYLGFNSGLADGIFRVADTATGGIRVRRSICGHEYEEQDKVEAYNSFPAISACITAAARVKLWELILSAGRSNVFYCDTDSLIVNLAGYRRLRRFVHPAKLGKLKLEYETHTLTINAPKDYATDTEHHRKGITPDAKQVRRNVFDDWQWEGVRGALGTGHLDGVYITRRRKVLRFEYDKGTVHASGAVSPVRF